MHAHAKPAHFARLFRARLAPNPQFLGVMAEEEVVGDIAGATDLDRASMDVKTVLVVFKNRRRPICFEGSVNPLTEKKNLLDAVQRSFADVITSGEGTSRSACSSGYFLQTESSEWGGLVDVTGHVQDRATVILQHCQSPGKAQVWYAQKLQRTPRTISPEEN